MTEFSALLWQQLYATSLWEWLAVLLALAYVILAVKENIWCWPAAFFSTIIYAVLFFDVNLYMESLLNFYYLAMAVYGWYQWRFFGGEERLKPVIIWTVNRHFWVILLTALPVVLCGFLLGQYTDQSFPYIDSFTTWFAIVTTYMVTQKVLENWLYWIVIDAVSIYLYLQKGFALTALLFTSYLIIALFGWLQWRRHYQVQQNQNHRNVQILASHQANAKVQDQSYETA